VERTEEKSIARDMVLFPAAHDDRAQDDGFTASVIGGTKAWLELARRLGDDSGGRGDCF
jgi:hypothetical protein